MKKYGKYEKIPAAAKQPKAKSVLLQTYFTSLICMILCVTMFFGTSYAWFTSEVTNEGNQIYIGTLDVDLLDKDGNSLAGNANPLFSDSVRWEPGYTALETVRVVDQGDLAFRYELTFIEGADSDLGSFTLQNVAQWFDVWCYNDTNNTIPAPVNYDQISEANGWTKVGSLAEVLAGKTVFSGKMTETDVNADPAAEHTYTIALHMKGEDIAAADQEAFNSLMGKKISLNVKLVATQMGSEVDGFGNPNYDDTDIAYVSTLDELQTALTEGKNPVLTSNIEVKTGEIKVNGGIFNGNDMTVTGKSSNTSLTLIQTTGGVIKNVVLDSNHLTLQGIGAGMTDANPLTEDLYIDNVTVYAAYYSVVGTANGVKIVINDSTLHGGISYPGTSSIEVKHTTFAFDVDHMAQYTGIEIAGNTSFENCEFNSVYALGAYDEASGATITFTNCTVDGVKLTAEDFAAKLTDTSIDYSGATVENLKNCTIIVDGVEVTW